MGIVYHANYLVWMEVGRTALIKELGFLYKDMEDRGVLSPVLDISISYKSRSATEKRLSYILGLKNITDLKPFTATTSIIRIKNLPSKRHPLIYALIKSFKPIQFRKAFPDWHAAYEKAKIRSGCSYGIWNYA